MNPHVHLRPVNIHKCAYICMHISRHTDTAFFFGSDTDASNGTCALTARSRGRVSFKLLTDAHIYPPIPPSFPPPLPPLSLRLCVCYSANTLRFLLINCRSVATSSSFFFSSVPKQLAVVSAAIRADEEGVPRL